MGHRRSNIGYLGLDNLMVVADREIPKTFVPKKLPKSVDELSDAQMLDEFLMNEKKTYLDKINALTLYGEYVHENAATWPELAIEFRDNIFRRLGYLRTAAEKTLHMEDFDETMTAARRYYTCGYQNNSIIN